MSAETEARSTVLVVVIAVEPILEPHSDDEVNLGGGREADNFNGVLEVSIDSAIGLSGDGSARS